MLFFSQKRPKYEDDPNFKPNTVIGEGVTVMGGVIKGINSVMVNGLVFGDINVDGEVIVTESGYVKGNIVSTFAVIAGIVEGNLQLTSYASLKSTASVTGDITCTAISIDDGAVFTGLCNMLVKSNAMNKKLRRINEHALSMLEEKEKAASTAKPDMPAALPANTEAGAEEAEELPAVDDMLPDGGDPVWFNLEDELTDEVDEDTAEGTEEEEEEEMAEGAEAGEETDSDDVDK